MKRSVLVAIGVQVAIVAAVAAPRLYVRLTAEEYLLRVQPVDPIDPFRGAYVTLSYTGFERSFEHEQGLDLDRDTAYVTLTHDGIAWVGDRILAEPPASGPYVTCDSSDFELECGIESWFLPQDRARAVERQMADGGLARVRISGSGQAVLVDVRP